MPESYASNEVLALQRSKNKNVFIAARFYI
jgi:hypothetical protein